MKTVSIVVPGNCTQIDAEYVIYRLEEAGRTLMALPDHGYSTWMHTSNLETIQSVMESYGYTDETVRPAVPSAHAITRMEEALAWLMLIPRDRYVLRRIVGARCLVSPRTDRHLFTWRRVGRMLGADHHAIQRWHSQGIDMIVAALQALRRVAT